jgi:hypothetical protein
VATPPSIAKIPTAPRYQGKQLRYTFADGFQVWDRTSQTWIGVDGRHIPEDDRRRATARYHRTHPAGARP